jgi:hypothetical protein
MTQAKRTQKAVFILESLKFEDEAQRRFEGDLLQQHLHLAGIESEYFYFRTDIEFGALLQEFKNRKFRYLHLGADLLGQAKADRFRGVGCGRSFRIARERVASST